MSFRFRRIPKISGLFILRKLIGFLIATSGVIIILYVVPSWVMWAFLGIIMMYAGWVLFRI